MAAEPLADYALLIDARIGPGRNDEAYEGLVLRFVPQLFGGFTRVAVVVRTLVGAMHTQRLLSSSTIAVEVFHDYDEARAYLRSGKRARPSAPPRH